MPARRLRSTLLAALLIGALAAAGGTWEAEATQRVQARAAPVRQADARPLHWTAKERTAQAKPAAPGGSGAAAPGPAVLSALQRAEAATGADPALLFAIARRESGFDPAARNRRSSARGLMQFTDATWFEAVRDHGHRHGLAPQAAALAPAALSG